MTLEQFIEDHTNTVEALATEAHGAYWDFETTGKEEAMNRAAEADKKHRGVYAEPGPLAFLKGIDGSSISDARTRRIHKLLVDAYRGGQMSKEAIAAIVAKETEIGNIYNHFRSELNGEKVSDNVIVDILRASNDKGERRAAWEASKQIGPSVAPLIREVADLRNRESKRLGFKDFYWQSMELQEQNVDELFGLLGELDRASELLFTKLKSQLDEEIGTRCRLSETEKSMPWNYADPFFQGAPPGKLNLDKYFEEKNLEELTIRFFDRIGLPIADLLPKSSLYEAVGKNQHASCHDIDRKGDVRVLCNIRPTSRWMGTMLHEFGHAVYDKYMDASLPWLLRTPSHILTTEAIAIFMGGLSSGEAWLKEYVGVEPSEAAAVAAEARREDRAQKLIFTRWVLVMTAFERGMYENPDRDLNSFWWDSVTKFQQVRKPEGRNGPDWATKLHVALAPAYYHNYLLGDMYACQLRHHILTNVLDGGDMHDLVTSKRLGEFLRDGLFAMGASHEWKETIERTTGEPLNPAYFVKECQE